MAEPDRAQEGQNPWPLLLVLLVATMVCLAIVWHAAPDWSPLLGDR